MVLDPKHFEDMDDFCDFDDKLDTVQDTDLGESGSNHALSWRRIIIERAANNVKKAHELKADVKAAYKKGSLVFDEQANRFGRVVESRPGFLNMSLVTGGNLVRQDINPMVFVRENRHKLTLPEIAKTLAITEVEVLILLNQVELESESPHSSARATMRPEKELKVVKTKIVAKAEKPKLVKKKPLVKVALTETKLTKTKIKIAAKKKATPAKKVPTGKDAVSFTKLLPRGATTDPVVDPNGYIQQNFLLMSNRELATATGLSEHTIRRKLGEWNLKRKDFVNKA